MYILGAKNTQHQELGKALDLVRKWLISLGGGWDSEGVLNAAPQSGLKVQEGFL
jgi:hypothetical protein